MPVVFDLKQRSQKIYQEIALNAISADVGFVEIDSDKGHDSFLLDVPDFLNALKNFIDKSYMEN